MAFRKHTVLAFALLAFSVIALGCAEDATAPKVQNEAPVLAPTNVQAVVINGGDIQVSWNPSSQVNVIGYNVYRLDVANSQVGRLNTSRIETTSFTDVTALNSHEYEYRVTSVGPKGAESGFAAVVIQNRNSIGDGKGGDPGETE